MKNPILVKDVIAFLGNKILNVYGNYDGIIVDNVADLSHTTTTTLDWVNDNKPNMQEIAEGSIAKVIIVCPKVEYSDAILSAKKVLLVVENPKEALMHVIKKYFIARFTSGIAPTAWIHPNAKIGKNNYIGPNCYIGDCIIGDNNVIHSNVCIYDRTTIGNNNSIHSGALICVDGLGCVRQADNTLLEFPQLGGVIIGNNCYIGGGVHIASGSLSDTIIEDGCKINGLTFIGSNNHLHENVWITGSTMLCGSVHVGKNTNIFSRVVVRDWNNIGEGCTVGMGSTVTKNIPNGETWVGTPAKKFEKQNK